jgi:hypothetical protein
MTVKKKSRGPGRSPKSAPGERQMVGTRVAPEVFQQLTAAAEANRNSLSREVELRLERSLKAEAIDLGDEFLHEIVGVFEGIGRRASRGETEDGRELPSREWIKLSTPYTAATCVLLELLADRHPEPAYGTCALMMGALSGRLERRWQALLDRTQLEDPEKYQRLINHAEALKHHASRPSLFDLKSDPTKKDKD